MSPSSRPPRELPSGSFQAIAYAGIDPLPGKERYAREAAATYQAAAWREDYDAIGAALEGAGWRHTPVANEVVGTRYRLGRAEAEFTFVAADSEGRIPIPMTEQPIVWSAEPFGDHRLTLGGVNSRTIPLDLLRAGKAMSRAGAADAEKDRADFEALSQLQV